MNSLRTRLLIWLLGAVLLIGVAGGFIIYRNSLAEANAFFDYHLRETALLLRDQAYGFAPPDGLPQQVPQYDFVVQVWSLDGQRLYLSQPTAVLPVATTLGFTTVDSREAGRWRVFGVLARGHVIQVAQALKVREDRAARLALRTLAPIGLLMPALALLIWWIVGRSLRPLGALAGSVRARSPTTLDPLSTGGLPEEVRPVVEALNDLLSRLAVAREHERAFIADAAHELRSPLTALSLQLQALASAGSDVGRGEATEQLKAGVARATRLVEQLLTLARHEQRPGHEAGPVALDDLAREAIMALVPLADSRQIDLGVASAEPATVLGDADALRVLLENLVDNAIRYTPQGGRVDVAVSRRPGGGEPGAVLEVCDTGPGIPDSERDRVFDRFYRVPGTAEAGSGIGLAIVKSIAERHGAAIEFGPGDGGHGLRVRVTFPGPSPG
jgi:two-component system, OmpR family, sensor kinase